jgi:hypothetical protein
MPRHDIIDNRHAKLVDSITTMLGVEAPDRHHYKLSNA